MDILTCNWYASFVSQHLVNQKHLHQATTTPEDPYTWKRLHQEPLHQKLCTPETFETRYLYKPTRELLHQTTSTLEFEHTHKPLLSRTSFAELLLHQRLLRQKYLHQKLDTKELLHQRPCARRLLLHNPFTPPEGDPLLQNTERRRWPAQPCELRNTKRRCRPAWPCVPNYKARQTILYKVLPRCVKGQDYNVLLGMTKHYSGLFGRKVQHLKLLITPMSQIKTMEK